MQRFSLPLLDRFYSAEATQLQSNSTNRAHVVQQLTRGIIRDLQMLLNTRREAARELPEEFLHVRRSLVMYGLPDCTTLDPDSRRDRQQLRRVLEQAILTFEPRLSHVRVVEGEPHRPSQKHDQILCFRIEAELHSGLMPEEGGRVRIAFQVLFQLPLKKYVVQGDL